MLHEFTEGQRVYLRDGRKAEFLARTSHGVVVRLGFYRPDGDGEFDEEYYEGVEIVSEVFVAPPIEAHDRQIASLEERELAARARLMNVEREITEAERRHADRLKRLSKHPPLDMLEALLDGRVTHFATKPPYSPVGDIQTFEEATTRIDREYGREKKDIRMLALVGKGDLLTWKINEYYDGSGSWRCDAYPCLSYEDAHAKVAEFCVAAATALSRYKIDSRHIIVADNAKKYGIEIPQWVHDAVADMRAKGAQAKVAKAEAELAKAMAQAAD